MNVVRLLPVFVSALLLAAHFSRNDLPLLIPLSLAFPLLLLIRRPWAARAVQALLVLGALEWVRRLVQLALQRQADGESWARLAAILGAVAVFTAASALVFRLPALRERYGR
jgi:hypothetical protein